MVCCGWLGSGVDEASDMQICSHLHGYDILNSIYLFASSVVMDLYLFQPFLMSIDLISLAPVSIFICSVFHRLFRDRNQEDDVAVSQYLSQLFFQLFVRTLLFQLWSPPSVYFPGLGNLGNSFLDLVIVRFSFRACFCCSAQIQLLAQQISTPSLV